MVEKDWRCSATLFPGKNLPLYCHRAGDVSYTCGPGSGLAGYVTTCLKHFSTADFRRSLGILYFEIVGEVST